MDGCTCHETCADCKGDATILPVTTPAMCTSCKDGLKLVEVAHGVGACVSGTCAREERETT